MTDKNIIKVAGLECTKCNDVIWSRYRHDFRWCKCQTIAIDGGRDYCKISGAPEDMISLLLTVDVKEDKILEIKKDV